jgi:hypothetical protein
MSIKKIDIIHNQSKDYDNMRTCSHCKECKNDDEFYIAKNKNNGHCIKDSTCKKCRIVYNCEWRRKRKIQKMMKGEFSSNTISPDLIDALIRKLTLLEEKVAKQEDIIMKSNPDLSLVKC